MRRVVGGETSGDIALDSAVAPPSCGANGIDLPRARAKKGGLCVPLVTATEFAAFASAPVFGIAHLVVISGEIDVKKVAVSSGHSGLLMIFQLGFADACIFGVSGKAIAAFLGSLVLGFHAVLVGVRLSFTFF